MKRILILGSFDDGNNIGDTAILSALIADFREELPGVEFIVPVRRLNALKTYPVRTIWSRLLLFDPFTVSAVFQADLVLIGQGTIFDPHLFNVTYNRLFGFAYLCTLAKKLGKKVALYNAGLGPVSTPLGNRLARYVVEQADIITLREGQSAEYLERWQVQTPHWVAADAALNTRPVVESAKERIWAQEGISQRGTNVAFNVTMHIERTFGSKEVALSRDRFIEICAEVSDRIVEELDGRVFFVATQKSDAGVHKEIHAAMRCPGRARLIVPMLQYTPEEFVSFLSGMDLVIGSRMHCLILSAVAGTPVIGLVYAPKTRNFMENIGQAERVIELRNLSEELLSALVRDTLDRREELVSSIASVIAPMKLKARESATLAADLVR